MSGNFFGRFEMIGNEKEKESGKVVYFAPIDRDITINLRDWQFVLYLNDNDPNGQPKLVITPAADE